MSQADQLPEWVQVGHQVAVVSSLGGGSKTKLTTVTKIGKRDIVLATEQRFNRNHFQGSGHGGRFAKYGDTWSPTLYLCPLGDELVVSTLAKQRRQQVRDVLHNELDTWVKDGDQTTLGLMIERLQVELNRES